MKISVPNPLKRKYPKDLTRDVSTTMDFGFMQPLYCRELMADASVHLQIPQIIRLGRMPRPTFGHCTLNTYTMFIPMESIFHPWEALLTQQSYRGSSRRYIPDQVITVSCGFLFSVLKACSIKHVYEIFGDTAGTQPATLSTGRVTWRKRSHSVTTATASSVYSYWYDAMAQFSCGLGSGQDLDQVIDPMVNGDVIDKKKLGIVASEELLSFYDWYDTVTVSSKTYLVCGKYTNFCRNLRKIFIGCGYKLNNSNKHLTMLPLLAYYRAYFELFQPKRDITWHDTFAAGFQEWCEQNGRFTHEYICQQQVASDLLGNFFIDLAKCYYTQNPDYVSAHITGQRISTVSNERRESVNTDNTGVNYSGTYSAAGTGASISGSTNGTGIASGTITSKVLTQSALDLLKAVADRLNVKNAFGGNIKAALRSLWNSDTLGEDDTFYINSQKLDVFVEAAISNAETAEGSLGEYAGYGIGKSEMEKSASSFTAKAHGYLIVMSGVVPEARYCQNVDPMLGHVQRVDFHDIKFDSLTLLPTAKMFIYGENEYGNQDAADTSLNDGFGNIPNYMEYCCTQNITNGDFNLPSTRNTYLPYNLDKLLPYTYAEESPDHPEAYGQITNLNTNLLVNGTIWRFIGLDRWLGNYDRIFTNSGDDNYLSTLFSGRTGDLDPFKDEYDNDNFIVHCKCILKVQDYKLPVQDSFMTGEFDSMQVEKA